jgi:hypothetical protein
MMAKSPEMAYHNGMTGVYSGAPGQLLLMSYKRGITAQTEKDLRSSSLTGHPDLASYPFMWTANRHFSNDPMIAANFQSGIVRDNNGDNWSSSVAQEVWPFLGFPSHQSGSSTSATPVPSVNPSPTCQVGQCPSAAPTAGVSGIPSGQLNPSPTSAAATPSANPPPNGQSGNIGNLLQQLIDFINKLLQLISQLFSGGQKQ